MTTGAPAPERDPRPRPSAHSEVEQMKRIAIGCLVALGLVVGGATAANAGEFGLSAGIMTSSL